MDVSQHDIFLWHCKYSKEMLEFSFCWTGRREGQSEKEKGEALGNKRVLDTGWQSPWYRVTLIGKIPGKKAAKLCDGRQTKAVKGKGRNLWVRQHKDQVTSPELQVLHPPGARCQGMLLFVLVGSCSFYLSLGLGSGAEAVKQQAQRGERRLISPVVKACVCHYILKMWCSDSKQKALGFSSKAQIYFNLALNS